MDVLVHTLTCTRVFLSRVEAPGCIMWAPLLTAANCHLLGTGVSWCRPESQESGLAAQVLSHRSLVTGKLSFHLLSENCQALLTRGEMGKAYFFVTDLQKTLHIWDTLVLIAYILIYYLFLFVACLLTLYRFL